MGGLAHFLEEEGIATTQISLIRKHTEKTNPPRALWVPFELGRPVGVPNDAEFQSRVLLAALRILEAPSGPIIEDFPEEAPISKEPDTVWACPVELKREHIRPGDTDQLKEAFKDEIGQLLPWYDLAVKKRGRTTVGVSGLKIEEIGDFICTFLDGEVPKNINKDIPPGFAIKLAVDDLKAIYTEAVAAQPGRAIPGSLDLVNWFWDETVAGKLLLKIKDICVNSDDAGLQLFGKLLLVPLVRGTS